MIKKIASSQEVWRSPDNKIIIWEVKAEDGTGANTMSVAIGNGIGKEFDIVEYINPKNQKTYWKQTPKDGAKGFNENFTAARWAVSSALELDKGELKWDEIEANANQILALAKKVAGL